MSICSDIYISLDEARKRVKEILLYDQTKLIENAVKGMSEWELSHVLSKDSDLYYYHVIEDEDE